MSVNSHQVGGDHYKTSYEHWDFCIDTGMGYLAGNATKYVARWRKKGGMEDLKKALHYVNKLIEVARSGRFDFESGIDPEDAIRVNRFARVNGLGMQEFDVCFLLMKMRGMEDLTEARDIILALMDQVEPVNPRPVPLEDSNKHGERA